jgi:hypothetical protein
MGYIYLNLDYDISVFFLLITNSTIAVYNIQLIATSASTTSVFSLPVSTTIPYLIISEFNFVDNEFEKTN